MTKYEVGKFPSLLVVRSVNADGSPTPSDSIVAYDDTELSLSRLVDFLEPFALDNPLIEDIPGMKKGAKGATGGTTKGERRRKEKFTTVDAKNHTLYLLKDERP